GTTVAVTRRSGEHTSACAWHLAVPGRGWKCSPAPRHADSSYVLDRPWSSWGASSGGQVTDANGPARPAPGGRVRQAGITRRTIASTIGATRPRCPTRFRSRGTRQTPPRGNAPWRPVPAGFTDFARSSTDGPTG